MGGPGLCRCALWRGLNPKTRDGVFPCCQHVARQSRITTLSRVHAPSSMLVSRLDGGTHSIAYDHTTIFFMATHWSRHGIFDQPASLFSLTTSPATRFECRLFGRSTVEMPLLTSGAHRRFPSVTADTPIASLILSGTPCSMAGSRQQPGAVNRPPPHPLASQELDPLVLPV
jgi:hypothetical protein